MWKDFAKIRNHDRAPTSSKSIKRFTSWECLISTLGMYGNDKRSLKSLTFKNYEKDLREVRELFMQIVV